MGGRAHLVHGPGVPTEAVLDEMRNSDPPVRYLVGTPKGRLSRLEQALLTKDWHQARPGVRVKLLAEDEELYVYAESGERIAKERSMRRRQLKWLWARLAQLQAMKLSRNELLMKLGAARSKAPRRGGWSTWTSPSKGGLHVRVAPRQAAPRSTPRGPLPAAHEPDRIGPG